MKGEDGTLHLSSNKLEAQGADIINKGKGTTLVQAKTALNLTALLVRYDEKMGGGNDSRREKIEKAVVSHIKGKGNVTVAAKDLLSEGARLESAEKLTAIAENDLVLNGAKESSDFEEFHQTKSGSLAKTTKTSLDKAQLDSHVGTQLSGKDILLSAGKDVKAKGLQGIADKNLSIQAGEDVVLATDSHRWRKRPRLCYLIKKLRILPINVGRTNVQNPLDFLTALLVDRHKRGRLRHRGGS